MNKYKAFYNGRETEVDADTLFGAKEKAIQFFRPPKSKAHMVHVHLLSVGGREVVHSTASIG